MGFMLLNPKRMDDEILYSYILRLSATNGFPDASHFKDYINGGNMMGRPSYFRYDTFEYLGHIFSHIDGLDWSVFFSKSTIYPLIAPLLVSAKQGALLGNCFHQHNPLKYTPNKFITQLKICPECLKEMKQKYGFWWYLKSQNLPFVTTCEKHNCKLITYTGPKGHELEYELFAPLEAPANPQFDNFIREMSNQQLDCALEDLKPALVNAFDSIGLNVLQDRLVSNHLDKLIHNSLEYTRKRILPSYSEFNWADALILLYICFPEPENIPIPGYKQEEIRELQVASQGYHVFYPFRRNLIEMEHICCNTHFLTTPKAFLEGWECPTCLQNLSPNEMFKRMVEISGYGEYKVLSAFESLSKKVTIKHTICGQTYTILPRSFLFEHKRCPCNSQISIDQARQRITPMKLIRFNSTETDATFRCPECGKTFTTKYINYTRHPYCRICGNQKAPRNRSNQDFKQDLKKLVGTEYTLMGNYTNMNTPITLKHNKCKKEFTILPRDFFQGTRCPFCRKQMPDPTFYTYVNTVSIGVYKVIEKSKERYKVINTQTNESVTLTKAMILQELNKPTPSTVLPLERKDKYQNTNREDELKRYIQGHYKACDIIFIEDLKSFNQIPSNQLKSYLKKLIEKKFLKRITTGAYAYYNSSITVDDIINQKYINRKNQHIGFNYGDELAYNLGIIQKKPVISMIITNKESQLHGRNLKINGKAIKIKGCAFTITEENWQILQMVSLLESSYRFGWDIDQTILTFMKNHNYSADDFEKYITKPQIIKKFRRIINNAKKDERRSQRKSKEEYNR